MSNRIITAALTALLLSGCSLADRFKTPVTETPANYKEATAPDAKTIDKNLWKPVAPMADAGRGSWWTVFGDERLNNLERQAIAENQTLKAAAARVDEARDFARSQAPTFLPDLGLGGNAVRTQTAGASLSAFGAPASGPLKPYTLYEAQGVATYEVDLFGAVRSNYNALTADAAAAKAAYNSVLLTLQADVAQNYFALRALDAESKLLRDTVATRGKAQNLMQKKFDQGDARTQDIEQARSDLASAQADLAGVERSRATLEHALAVLLGELPSSFDFAAAPLADVPPAVPAGLPSTLLSRRPDVAGALSSMAAANQRIGLARSAFYPTLDLAASGGFEATSLASLFTWPMRTWALGQLASTALNLTIFDSGRRSASLDRAHAAYDEAVANYRQQVLVAFRDVEDNLSDQRLLAQQSKAADTAARTATHATELTQKRFNDGDADYFEVVEQQRISLAAERAAIQLRGQRFITAVNLIRALGGGWQDATAPAFPAAAGAVPAHPAKQSPVRTQK